MSGGSVGRILRVCTTLATIHSLLVSKPAKDLARRIAGHRYRNGLYRLFFNTQLVFCLAGAAQWFFAYLIERYTESGCPGLGSFGRAKSLLWACCYLRYG